MKFEHKKIKNTGIIFEMLVRQLTTDTINNIPSKAGDIIKKYFTRNEIAKEFKIYKTLSSTKNLSEGKAESLINSSLEAYKRLDTKALKNLKYSLIAEIKKNYDIEEFFKPKVENYKTLASIYLILEMYATGKFFDEEKFSKYKFILLENMSQKEEERKDDLIEQFRNEDIGTRNLIYKMMIKKFNEKYDFLNEHQKEIVHQFIKNNESSTNFRNFFNNKIQILSEELMKKTKTVEDQVKKLKLEEVHNFIKPVPENKSVSEKDIQNILYFYQLLEEI